MIRRAIVVVTALLLAGCVYFAQAQSSSTARIRIGGFSLGTVLISVGWK